jgi:hypothetical protein
MSIRVEKEFSPGQPCHVSHVTIGERVPLSGANFEEDVSIGGHFSLFTSNKARVCQNINIRALERCFVSTFLYRFNDGFSMDHHQPGAQLLGPPGALADCLGGEMGKLNAWDCQNRPVRSRQGAVPGGLRDYPLQIANTSMVGERNGLVLLVQGSVDKFHR